MPIVPVMPQAMAGAALPSGEYFPVAASGIASYGFIVELVSWFLDDPLEDYDRSKQYTVPDCTVEILVGHYTKTPHIYHSGPCSGVTIRGCAAAGMTIKRWFRPDVIVPPKQITPFPGSQPLSTDFDYPDDTFAASILKDYDAALAYARQICANEACNCPSVTVSIKYIGFDDDWHDTAIKDALRARGVTEKSEVVTR